jgi:hypothetical protein
MGLRDDHRHAAGLRNGDRDSDEQLHRASGSAGPVSVTG